MTTPYNKYTRRNPVTFSYMYPVANFIVEAIAANAAGTIAGTAATEGTKYLLADESEKKEIRKKYKNARNVAKQVLPKIAGDTASTSAKDTVTSRISSSK